MNGNTATNGGGLGGGLGTGPTGLGGQLRAINLVTTTSNGGVVVGSTGGGPHPPQQQTRQIILSKSQASIINRSLQQQAGGGGGGGGGSGGAGQIIVLTPANRGLNEQGIQLLIQQKSGPVVNSGNVTTNTSTSATTGTVVNSGASSTTTPAKIFVQAAGSSISMLKNIQMNNKPRLAAATNITPVVVESGKTASSVPHTPILTTVTSASSPSLIQHQQPKPAEFHSSSSNSHIIGLLNSHRTIQPAASTNSSSTSSSQIDSPPSKPKRPEKCTKG